jgi:hypothetical protein
VPAWHGAPIDPRRTGEYSRSQNEWMPRPFGGRVMVTSRRVVAGKEPIYVEVVPGPGGMYQIVRIDLARPLARGFASPQSARAWVARAIRQGVLPEGVIVVEPPREKE